MSCNHDDLVVETVTFNYDAFGNPVNETVEQLAEFDLPVILSPYAASESEVDLDFRIAASLPTEDEYESDLDEIAFDLDSSDFIRCDMPEEIGLQYNAARSFDPRIGRWLSRDGLVCQAGDDNVYPYPHAE